MNWNSESLQGIIYTHCNFFTMQQNSVTVFCNYEINWISVMAKIMLIKVLGKKQLTLTVDIHIQSKL